MILRMITVHPACQVTVSRSEGAAGVLAVRRAKGHSARRIGQAFGLTGAEARLAAELVEGAGVEGIALKFGISRDTARNQLKAIFSKTGTHRQAELVLLLNEFRF